MCAKFYLEQDLLSLPLSREPCEGTSYNGSLYIFLAASTFPCQPKCLIGGVSGESGGDVLTITSFNSWMGWNSPTSPTEVLINQLSSIRVLEDLGVFGSMADQAREWYEVGQA